MGQRTNGRVLFNTKNLSNRSTKIRRRRNSSSWRISQSSWIQSRGRLATGIKHSNDTSISCSSTPILPRTSIWCRRTWILALVASITPKEIWEYLLLKKEGLVPRTCTSSSFPIWMLKIGRAIDSNSAAAWSNREQAGVNLQGMIKSNLSDRPC